MMLKVEELVCKTCYFNAMKTGLGLGFNLTMNMSLFLLAIMHRYIMHSENVCIWKMAGLCDKMSETGKMELGSNEFLHVSYLLLFPFWFYD